MCVCVLGLGDSSDSVTIRINTVTIMIALPKIPITQIITPPLPHAKLFEDGKQF